MYLDNPWQRDPLSKEHPQDHTPQTSQLEISVGSAWNTKVPTGNTLQLSCVTLEPAAIPRQYSQELPWSPSPNIQAEMILAMVADSMSALRVGVQAQPMSMKRISRIFQILWYWHGFSFKFLRCNRSWGNFGPGAWSHKHSRPKEVCPNELLMSWTWLSHHCGSLWSNEPRHIRIILHTQLLRASQKRLLLLAELCAGVCHVQIPRHSGQLSCLRFESFWPFVSPSRKWRRLVWFSKF